MMKSMLLLFLLVFASCSNKVLTENRMQNFNGVDFLQTGSNESATIQLNMPQYTIDSMLFINQATLELEFDYPNADIYYSINDGLALKCLSKITTNSSCTIDFYSKATGFLPSETQSLTLIKVQNDISEANISVSHPPNDRYTSDGTKSLIDLKKGGINFRDGNYWLGFQSQDLIITLDLEKAIPMEILTLSLLKDHGAWIFLPQEITVTDGDSIVGNKKIIASNTEQQAALEFIDIKIEARVYQRLAINIKSMAAIPSWHVGVGTPPWLFIDEIIVE